MICLTEPARATIEREARLLSDGRETGGILLGHDASADGPLLITVAGEPGPKTTQTAGRFLRDLDYSQRLADEAYDRDGSVWVGEWHTHPKGPTRPSRRDLLTYHQLLVDKELDFVEFAAIIVTMDRGKQQVSFHGWLLSLAPRSPEELLARAVEIGCTPLPTDEERR